jgi:hypothetical protein
MTPIQNSKETHNLERKEKIKKRERRTNVQETKKKRKQYDSEEWNGTPF